MKNQFKSLWKQEKSYKHLAVANCKEICEHNEKMLSATTLIGGLLLIMPLIAVPFRKTKVHAAPAYFLTSLFSFTLFFLFKIYIMKKYSRIGLYICFSIFYIFGIYLSVIYAPNMRATILLGAFCLVPLCIVDNPYRINMFVGFWFVVHTILAFYLKPQYALDDTINCLCFVILGCYIGNIMVRTRLESYEVHRQLTIQKETDVLTGLFNRRKLFETLADLEKLDAEENPSGIFMIDIDFFKEFNDKYGHATGDKCLSHLGSVLTKYAQNFRLQFYRYGGEEFLGMAYGYGEKELFFIAESLRIAVQSTQVDEHCTTVSIGVAYCADEEDRNYREIIERADKAAYAAKRTGRNKVHIGKREDQVQ